MNLVNDLISIIATYTTNTPTLHLLTIDASLAARSYTNINVWLDKIYAERKGLMFDDSVIGNRWYAAYRVLSERIDHGALHIFTGNDHVKIVDDIASVSVIDNHVKVISSSGIWTWYEYLVEARRAGVAMMGYDPRYNTVMSSGPYGVNECSTVFQFGCEQPILSLSDGLVSIRSGRSDLYALDRCGKLFGLTGQRIKDITSHLNERVTVYMNNYVPLTRNGMSNLTSIPPTEKEYPVRSVLLRGSHPLNVYIGGDISHDYSNVWSDGPRVARAVFGNTVNDVLVLDFSGRVHLYQNGTYVGLAPGLPARCSDLFQIGSRYGYVSY